MIQVQVHLYATLRSYVGGAAEVNVAIKTGQTLGGLLEQLQIPPEQTRIRFVNNRAAQLDQCLHEDDRVALFPALGGG